MHKKRIPMDTTWQFCEYSVTAQILFDFCRQFIIRRCYAKLARLLPSICCLNWIIWIHSLEFCRWFTVKLCQQILLYVWS